MRKRLGHAKPQPRVLRAACTISQPETKESHLSPQDAFTWTFVLLGATGVLLVVALILGLLKLRVPTIVAAVLAGGTSIAGSAINAGVTHGTSPLDGPLAVAGLSIGAAMVALAWRTREKVSPAPESAPLSVISVVALIVAFIATAVGIVLGYLGLRDTQNSTKRGRGLARAAVVIGWLGTVIWVIALSIGVWAALHQAGILHV